MEPQLIEDVVQSVLRELRAGSGGASASGSPESPGRLRVDDPVVTEGSLAGRLSGVREVVFSARTVLTPTARDLLQSRRIPWSRCGSRADEPAASTGPTVVVTHSTIAVGSAFRDANLLRVSPEKAIGAAAEAAENGGFLLLTDRPHAMAVELNRTPSMRAVAVEATDDLRRVIGESRANCVVAKPNGRSVEELQSLARAASKCGSSHANR